MLPLKTYNFKTRAFNSNEVRLRQPIKDLLHGGHLTQKADSLEKTDTGKDWRQKEKGTAECEMVR